MSDLLAADTINEMWELYWSGQLVNGKWIPDFKTTEIAEVYGIKRPAEVCRIVGPAVFGFLCCKECKLGLAVSSREKLKWDLQYRPLCNRCHNKIVDRNLIHFEEVAKQEDRALNLLKTMPYKDYLQTDHWKATRKSALSRACYRCQLCNGSSVLNVHHRTYERRGCEHREDLVVLCQDCHAKFHDKIPNA